MSFISSGVSLCFLVMKIAVMPGDGVGKEVVPAGLLVLKEAARKFNFTFTTTD
jgi:tartrate dehydrogenase/decarboxylase / D-malate dehydrogenase